MSDAKSASLISVRAGRERAIARLSDAFARDDLDLEEFERRLGIAHRTDSLAELDALTTDLTVVEKTALTAPAAAPVTTPAPLSFRERQSLVAILGGTMRKGPWTPPRKLRVVALLGGVELDFREASLAPGVTEVHITAVLGGVNIIVPPQLAVEMDGIAIMGGFEHSERAPVQPDPDRPILRVHGLAFWGGVNIETRLPGESERDAHRRAREHRRLQAQAERRALPPRRDP